MFRLLLRLDFRLPITPTSCILFDPVIIILTRGPSNRRRIAGPEDHVVSFCISEASHAFTSCTRRGSERAVVGRQNTSLRASDETCTGSASASPLYPRHTRWPGRSSVKLGLNLMSFLARRCRLVRVSTTSPRAKRRPYSVSGLPLKTLPNRTLSRATCATGRWWRSVLRGVEAVVHLAAQSGSVSSVGIPATVAR